MRRIAIFFRRIFEIAIEVINKIVEDDNPDTPLTSELLSEDHPEGNRYEFPRRNDERR